MSCEIIIISEHRIPSVEEIDQQRNNVIKNYYSQFKEYEDKHLEKWKLVLLDDLYDEREWNMPNEEEELKLSRLLYSNIELYESQCLLPTYMISKALNFTLDIVYTQMKHFYRLKYQNDSVLEIESFLNSNLSKESSYKIECWEANQFLEQYKSLKMKGCEINEIFCIQDETFQIYHVSILSADNDKIKELWSQSINVNFFNSSTKQYFGEEIADYLWQHVAKPNISEKYVLFMNQIHKAYLHHLQHQQNISIIKSPFTTLEKSYNDEGEYFDIGFGRAILMTTKLFEYKKQISDHEEKEESGLVKIERIKNFYKIKFEDTFLTGSLDSILHDLLWGND
jgi:hypothetical protein